MQLLRRAADLAFGTVALVDLLSEPVPLCTGHLVAKAYAPRGTWDCIDLQFQRSAFRHGMPINVELCGAPLHTVLKKRTGSRCVGTNAMLGINGATSAAWLFWYSPFALIVLRVQCEQYGMTSELPLCSPWFVGQLLPEPFWHLLSPRSIDQASLHTHRPAS